MASNGNGWAVKTLVGFLLSVILVVLSGTVNNVISNDKDSRLRDSLIKESVNCVRLEQQKINESILITLAEIKSDVKHLVKNGS